MALVLAAGSSRRFGQDTKQLAEVDGRPLVAHAVAAAHAGGADRVLVVVGHDAEAVAAAAATAGDVEVVHNPVHARGQASSLVAGVTAAGAVPGAEMAVVLLADQPGIAGSAVRAVTDAVRGGAVAARARYLDADGHPVAFARRCWDRLARLEGDQGARALFAELEVVPVPIDAPAPHDVDRPEDLRSRQ